MSENMNNGSFVEPNGFCLRKRKRKNGVDESLNNTMGLSLTENNGDPKRKKTLSRFTSVASVLSTPMAKAFKRSISNVRLSGSPAPSNPAPSSSNRNSLDLTNTPGRFFMRSASSAKVLQQQNTNTPESPLLKRGGVGRNSSTNLTPYKKPVATPNKQRPTRYWSEQYKESCAKLSKQEIRLQEALYEISTGEEDLVSDLSLIRKIYAESLVHLKILTQAEADLVFAKLYPIIPLHSSLACALSSLRDRVTGIIRPIGRVVCHWVNSLRMPYVDYCGNLIQTKAFIDYRRDTDKDFNDFLQRCIESPFSRKLDLWSYLDVPRSRLVKYPLLLRQVLKFSNANNEFAADMTILESAIENLENVLKDVDNAMAQARANFTVSRLEWLDEGVEARSSSIVANAEEEIISGTLRNNRGTKLECYLLDTVLILGRPSSRMSVVMTSSTASLRSQGSTASLCSISSTTSTQSNKETSNIRPTTKRLQVYRTPIPTSQLVIEDLNPNVNISGSFNDSLNSSGASLNNSVRHPGGHGGSFKSAFSGNSSQPGKNGFRVSFRNPSEGQAHTLFAPDEHSKKQWLAALKKVSGQQEVLPSETDSSSLSSSEGSCGGGTPVGKRVYAQGGKVAKNSARVGLFQKNRRSPRIKASLSHTALESVRSGGAVKKIRSTASTKKLQLLQDETSELSLSCSKRIQVVAAPPIAPIPYPRQDNGSATPPPTPPPRGLKRDTSKGSLVAAAVGRRIVKQQLSSAKSSPALKTCARISSKPPPIPPKSYQVRKLAGPRGRTKSWGHLQEKNASYHGETLENGQKRYITRSAAKKVSKSMSDLMGM